MRQVMYDKDQARLALYPSNGKTLFLNDVDGDGITWVETPTYIRYSSKISAVAHMTADANPAGSVHVRFQLGYSPLTLMYTQLLTEQIIC